MKQNKIPRNEYIIQPKGKTNPYKHDVIYSDLGQWKYPGQVTRIPSNQITMQGVPYPVQGVDDTGYSQMMYPGMDYQFPGQYVTEYPQMQIGGLIKKGLTAAKKVVKNTYKVNPWAEKLKNPNSSYRVAGLDAYDDFKNTGILRSATPNIPEGASLKMRAMYRPTSFPSFQKGYADLRYLPDEGGVIFKTDLPTFKRGDINPVTGFPIKGRHYAHRVIDPKTGAAINDIPASNIEVYSSEPHWLKGFMGIPKELYGGGLPKAQLGRIEQNINSWLGEPMTKAEEASAGGKWFNPKTKQLEQEDDVDNLRHPMAARYTSEAIANKFPNWMQYSGIPQAAGFLGSAGLGVGHELSSNKYTAEDPRDYRNYTFWDAISEAGEDILNNTVGAGVGALPISADKKTSFLRYLSDNNMLPDGVANEKANMYFKPFGGQNTKTHTHMKDGGSLNRKVTCSNCGWSWKLVDGGTDPMTCHKCGGTIKMQNGGWLNDLPKAQDGLFNTLYAKLNPYNWGVKDYSGSDELGKWDWSLANYVARANKAKEFMHNNKRYAVKDKGQKENWEVAEEKNPDFFKNYALNYFKKMHPKDYEKRYKDLLNSHYRYGNPWVNIEKPGPGSSGDYGRAYFEDDINQMHIYGLHQNPNITKIDTANLMSDYTQELLHARQLKDLGEKGFSKHIQEDLKRNNVHYEPSTEKWVNYDEKMYDDPKSIEGVHYTQGNALWDRLMWRNYHTEEDPDKKEDRDYYLNYYKNRKFHPYEDQNNLRTLQKALSEAGYDMSESLKKDGTYDGIYGDQTKYALDNWQKGKLHVPNIVKKSDKVLTAAPTYNKQMGGWLDELPEAQIGAIVKAGLKGIKKLNPIRVADKVVPQVGGLLNPAVLMGVESMNAMSMSPLNWVPGYGKKLQGKGQAFRKFGNDLQHVKDEQVLSPAGGSKMRIGRDQIVNEGNWAQPNEVNDSYPGVFEATVNPQVKGTNLDYKAIHNRNGVLITDAKGQNLPEIPISDPGLSFNRRLPFSNRYVPINKEKLIKKEFDLARTAPHLQSLAEKALGAAGVIAVHDYIQGDDKSDWFPQIKNQLDNSYNKVSKYVGPYLPKEEDGGNIQQAQFGKIIKTVTKAISKPVIKKAVVNKKYVLPSKEKIKDLHGFIPRRQFVKEMQKEGLIGKDFKDLNYAASSTDKTNALTKLALDRKATRYRGVEGKVPEKGIARQQSHPYQEYDMSKPARNNDISEFENMKNAGVDFNNPISIAKYQATHIPMQQYGYRSGMPYMSNLDALYSGHAPTGYGNYQIKITSPRDYSEGNYIDWVKKYHNPKNNLQDLAVKEGHYIKDFVPNTSYEMPVGLSKTDLTTVVGKRGQKMFDVDDTFPFMNYKKLSPKQELEFKDYVKGLGEDYNTGWKGKYKKGGWLDTMQEGGYKSEADYQAHLLDPYSAEKRAAQQSWLNQKKNNSLRSQMSKDNTSVKKPYILNPTELAYAQPYRKLSKEEQMPMYVDSAIANRQPDELRKTKKQGFGSKAHEVVMNPFTALTNLYQHGTLPDNFSQGETNALDFAVGAINPLTYLEAAYNTGKAAFDPETYKDLGKTVGLGVNALAGDQSPDEWKQAGLNTLFKGLDASMVKGAGNMVSKNAKRIINKNINKTSKNIKKGLEEQAGKYYQNAPGKMEGIGDIKDIKRSLMREDQYLKPSEYNSKAIPFSSYKPQAGGYTDVPQFNQELNNMMTTASFGKRPLGKNVKTNPATSKNALIEALDNARYEEGMTDLISSQYMKKAKIPYNAKKAFQNIQPNKYGGDLQEAQWGKIIKAGAKAISKPVAKVIKPVVKPVLKTLDKGLTHGVNAIRKVDEKVVIPIQFRKDIKKIKESAKKQHEYFQKPEVVEKLKSIGASPIAIRALQTPNQVDLTFKTGHGSYFDQLPGIINMDMRQMKEASKRFAMTPQQVYEHELGHQMQQYINIGSPEFQQAYAKYVKELEDYNIRKQISKRVEGTSTNLNPMAVRSKPDFLVNWNMPEAPQRLSKPTILDKQAAGMLRLKSKDQKTMTPEELNSLYYYHSEVPADGISKIGYDIENGTERLPHLREMRQSMIDNGYIPDATSPITEDIIRRFIKENPKNRIASIVDPTFQTNYKKLVKTFKHLPAVLPIGLGTAAALQNEEYKRGGQKGLKKYTSKNIQSSVNDLFMRNETLFGPAGKKRYKPGLKYKSGGNWLDNLT